MICRNEEREWLNFQENLFGSIPLITDATKIWLPLQNDFVLSKFNTNSLLLTTVKQTSESLYLQIPNKHGPWLPDTLLSPVHQQRSTPATEELQPQLSVLTAAYNLLKVLKTAVEGLWDEGLLQVERLLALKGHLCYDTQHTNTDLYEWKEATK